MTTMARRRLEHPTVRTAPAERKRRLAAGLRKGARTEIIWGALFLAAVIALFAWQWILTGRIHTLAAYALVCTGGVLGHGLHRLRRARGLERRADEEEFEDSARSGA